MRVDGAGRNTLPLAHPFERGYLGRGNVPISGPPGAGKSTRAVALSARLESATVEHRPSQERSVLYPNGGTTDEGAVRIGCPAGQTAFLATYEGSGGDQKPQVPHGFSTSLRLPKEYSWRYGAHHVRPALSPTAL